LHAFRGGKEVVPASAIQFILLIGVLIVCTYNRSSVLKRIPGRFFQQEYPDDKVRINPERKIGK
jgi:hypothetical protein